MFRLYVYPHCSIFWGVLHLREVCEELRVIHLCFCHQRPISAECVAKMMNSAIGASGHFTVQRLVAAADACCCWASWSERPVTFLQRLVQRPVTSVSSFLRDLAYGLVPIFVLGLCLISWVFSCAPRVLLMVLIVGSSCRLYPSHVLHPIELQNNYSQIH